MPVSQCSSSLSKPELASACLQLLLARSQWVPCRCRTHPGGPRLCTSSVPSCRAAGTPLLTQSWGYSKPGVGLALPPSCCPHLLSKWWWLCLLSAVRRGIQLFPREKVKLFLIIFYPLYLSVRSGNRLLLCLYLTGDSGYAFDSAQAKTKWMYKRR